MTLIEPQGAPPATTRPVVTRGLAVLLAVMAGVAVGNLYWAQPLLHVIGKDLHVSTGTAGSLVTATQVGYAVGILLIVPLGDVLDRRRLIPLMLVCSAAALMACAAAPTFGLLLGGIAILGVTTVAGQIAIPLAGDLANGGSRGRVISIVSAGFLAGALIPRTLSGLVAQYGGWRAIYLAAAVVSLILALLAHRSIPTLPPRARLAYPALLASVGAVVRQYRVVRWTLALSALQFALFTMFWTALTLLLSGEPYSYPAVLIGLFALLGLPGVLTAQRTGRLVDRGWSLHATGIAWALVLVSFVLLAFAEHSRVVLAVGIVLLHTAIFPMNVLISTRLFALVPEGRSRVNTSLIVVNFAAGAIGSTLVGALWSAGGWPAVSFSTIAVSAVGLMVWVIGRRGALADSARHEPTARAARDAETVEVGCHLAMATTKGRDARRGRDGGLG